jgi:hypothetical protein
MDMNDPSVNPQEVFRSQLPVGASLIVIFVPSRDWDGQPIDQEYWVGRHYMGICQQQGDGERYGYHSGPHDNK